MPPKATPKVKATPAPKPKKETIPAYKLAQISAGYALASANAIKRTG